MTAAEQNLNRIEFEQFVEKCPEHFSRLRLHPVISVISDSVDNRCCILGGFAEYKQQPRSITRYNYLADYLGYDFVCDIYRGFDNGWKQNTWQELGNKAAILLGLRGE